MTAETETAAPTATVRPLIVDVLAEHPTWDYLFHPELPVRPATAEELAAVEDRAHAEYEAFLAVPVSPEPHPPMCGCNRKEPAPEPEPAAVTVVDQPAEPAQDAPAGPQTIRDAAADRLGITAPDQKADEKYAAFSATFAEDPEGDGDRAQPDTTAQIAAVGDDTQVIEGDAK